MKRFSLREAEALGSETHFQKRTHGPATVVADDAHHATETEHRFWEGGAEHDATSQETDRKSEPTLSREKGEAKTRSRARVFGRCRRRPTEGWQMLEAAFLFFTPDFPKEKSGF